jgi:hypothetical protein
MELIENGEKLPPKHCLLCGRDVVRGIESHVKEAHNMRYDEYCKLFSECKGTYTVEETDYQRIIKITRILLMN